MLNFTVFTLHQNVMFGGFLFDEAASESKQVDVIVTTDTCPQFNFLNKDGDGKTFGSVEGTLATTSIKSNLTKNELFDSLLNLAPIPPTKPLNGRIPPGLKFWNYDDWLYKFGYSVLLLSTFWQSRPGQSGSGCFP